MKTLLIAVTAAASFVWVAPAFAGSCDHSWQTDRKGNSCGDRAADRRPGGK